MIGQRAADRTGTPRNANCVSALSESQDLRRRSKDLEGGILWLSKNKLGDYFLDALFFRHRTSLEIYAGIHMKYSTSIGCSPNAFPNAVYYKVDGKTCIVFRCSTAGKSRRKPWKDETVSACQAASPC